MGKPCRCHSLTSARPISMASRLATCMLSFPGSLVPSPGVRRVYPSQGNYLLVRFEDAERALARLLAAGVVVRDMRASPQLGDALRISIGKAEENDAVLAALGEGRAAA